MFSQTSLLSFPAVTRNLLEEKRKARLGINPRLARYHRATQPVYGGIDNSNTINLGVESGSLLRLIDQTTDLGAYRPEGQPYYPNPRPIRAAKYRRDSYSY